MSGTVVESDSHLCRASDLRCKAVYGRRWFVTRRQFLPGAMLDSLLPCTVHYSTSATALVQFYFSAISNRDARSESNRDIGQLQYRDLNEIGWFAQTKARAAALPWLHAVEAIWSKVLYLQPPAIIDLLFPVMHVLNQTPPVHYVPARCLTYYRT